MLFNTKYYFMRALLIVTCCLLSCIGRAQDVFHIKADSVRMYSDCDTVELVIRNQTKDTAGFLYNKWDGRTEFRRVQLEALADGRTAITGQDTATIRMPPPLSSLYLMTPDVCQSWNGAHTVIKREAGNLYLKLDMPGNLVDGKELYIGRQSRYEDDAPTGAGIFFYSYSVPIYFNGDPANAYKLSWHATSGVQIIYSAALNAFVIVNQCGNISIADRGSCPL